MNTNTKKLVTLAMLSAIAYVVMAFGRVPIIPGVEFLKYDPKDIIIAIGGFIFGPLSAFLMSLVVSLVEMVTVSESGIIGLMMNVISTCAFACTAAFIYKHMRSLAGAILGLIAGGLAMTGMMLLWNYIITPVYMKVPREVVVNMLAPVFLPFNLLKSGLNAAFAMLLYKPLVTVFRRSKLIPEPETDGEKPRFNVWGVLAGLFVLGTCLLLILVSR